MKLRTLIKVLILVFIFEILDLFISICSKAKKIILPDLNNIIYSLSFCIIVTFIIYLLLKIVFLPYKNKIEDLNNPELLNKSMISKQRLILFPFLVIIIFIAGYYFGVLLKYSILFSNIVLIKKEAIIIKLGTGLVLGSFTYFLINSQIINKIMGKNNLLSNYNNKIFITFLKLLILIIIIGYYAVSHYYVYGNLIEKSVYSLIMETFINKINDASVLQSITSYKIVIYIFLNIKLIIAMISIVYSFILSHKHILKPKTFYKE